MIDSKTNQEIIDNLKFYFMLSIFLKSHNVSDGIANKSLNEFIKEGEVWHRKNSKILNKYLDKAYKSLPLDFLKILEISEKCERDQIKFIEKGYWKK